MKHLTHKILMISALLLAMAPVQAAIGESVYERWQLKRLFQPGESQLKQEQKGKVFIYEGLRDRDIEHVLEKQFDRVQHMMFIGTVITDKKGKPKINPDTGLPLIEDDGC